MSVRYHGHKMRRIEVVGSPLSVNDLVTVDTSVLEYEVILEWCPLTLGSTYVCLQQ